MHRFWKVLRKLPTTYEFHRCVACILVASILTCLVGAQVNPYKAGLDKIRPIGRTILEQGQLTESDARILFSIANGPYLGPAAVAIMYLEAAAEKRLVAKSRIMAFLSKRSLTAEPWESRGYVTAVLQLYGFGGDDSLYPAFAKRYSAIHSARYPAERMNATEKSFCVAALRDHQFDVRAMAASVYLSKRRLVGSDREKILRQLGRACHVEKGIKKEFWMYVLRTFRHFNPK
jgi:hypothetical protein